MSFLTNWLFWVILVSIIFLLTIVGYLTESKKKAKKETVIEPALEPEPEPAPAPTVNPVPTVDNVETPSQPGAVLNLDNGTWSNNAPAQPAFSDQWGAMPNAETVQPEQPVVAEAIVEEAPAAQPQEIPTENKQEVMPAEPTVPSEPVVEPTVTQATDNTEVWK